VNRIISELELIEHLLLAAGLCASCCWSAGTISASSMVTRSLTSLPSRTGRSRLDVFDFSFQPSLSERLVRELACLRFVQTATNVVLLGPQVGKTNRQAP
jgi:hypothetical protein